MKVHIGHLHQSCFAVFDSSLELTIRYKKQEARLRSIAGSFRVFSDGLDLVVPAPVDNELA